MKRIIIVTLVGLLSACSVLDSASNLFPPKQSLATKMMPLESFKELKALPKPKGPIAVSVYAYRDQTGQYKPQANVSSFSTAVTQGATRQGVAHLDRAVQSDRAHKRHVS